MEVFAVRMDILDENGGRLIRILEKKKIPNAFYPMADFLCVHIARSAFLPLFLFLLCLPIESFPHTLEK